jgi:hypothetical protein
MRHIGSPVFVYIAKEIHSEELAYKIGVTSEDPLKRVKRLGGQSRHPHELVKAWTVSDIHVARDVERAVLEQAASAGAKLSTGQGAEWLRVDLTQLGGWVDQYLKALESAKLHEQGTTAAPVSLDKPGLSGSKTAPGISAKQASAKHLLALPLRVQGAKTSVAALVAQSVVEGAARKRISRAGLVLRAQTPTQLHFELVQNSPLHRLLKKINPALKNAPNMIEFKLHNTQ